MSRGPRLLSLAALLGFVSGVAGPTATAQDAPELRALTQQEPRLPPAAQPVPASLPAPAPAPARAPVADAPSLEPEGLAPSPEPPAPAPAPTGYGHEGTYPSPAPAPPEASALPSPTRGRGAREHEGFFLRLTLGVGAGSTTYREQVFRTTSDVTTRGIAGLFGVSVGGRVLGNLLLHGDLLVSAVADADKKVDGVRDASNRIDHRMALLGGGATYYFMPANVYVSTIAGIANLREERDGELAIATGETGLGVGFALLLGKEWWVGRRGEWGVGAALRTAFVTAPAEIARLDTRMRGSDVGLAFSATLH